MTVGLEGDRVPPLVVDLSVVPSLPWNLTSRHDVPGRSDAILEVLVCECTLVTETRRIARNQEPTTHVLFTWPSFKASQFAPCEIFNL